MDRSERRLEANNSQSEWNRRAFTPNPVPRGKRPLAVILQRDGNRAVSPAIRTASRSPARMWMRYIALPSKVSQSSRQLRLAAADGHYREGFAHCGEQYVWPARSVAAACAAEPELQVCHGAGQPGRGRSAG